jgi:succinate-semialdehyde dehydrogenase/glutarate-semialdehyde dehydrogenase
MTYQTINPYTEEVTATFPDHTDAELETILKLSHNAYREDWRLRSYQGRQLVIATAAALLREQDQEFARLATLEMGKPLNEAIAEVALSADILDYYAENAECFLAPRDLTVTHGQARIETAPLGPIFCVEPWNFPYYQLARVAGPNLMAGNTLIVKHAPGVPQCALAFERLFLDAGAPLGVYLNAFLSNEQAASAIADKRVVGVALTGSERAGAAVAAEAGKALKKTTMELGGSDAFIVLADADLELAVDQALIGRMLNTGQVCNGAKRFILEQGIARDFLQRFTARLRQLVPGDPLDPATTLAPLCSERALLGLLDQINQAVAHGAHVQLGGKRLERRGFFLEPTLLIGITPDNPAYFQEFFGPVALIFTVPDEAAALALANDSPYGLGAVIMTKNLAKADRIALALETGMVTINAASDSSPQMPFGGVKNSGFGRELSDLGIAEFVNRKLVKTV